MFIVIIPMFITCGCFKNQSGDKEVSILTIEKAKTIVNGDDYENKENSQREETPISKDRGEISKFVIKDKPNKVKVIKTDNKDLDILDIKEKESSKPSTILKPEEPEEPEVPKEPEKPEVPVFYLVKFINYDGSVLDTQIIEQGKS